MHTLFLSVSEFVAVPPSIILCMHLLLRRTVAKAPSNDRFTPAPFLIVYLFIMSCLAKCGVSGIIFVDIPFRVVFSEVRRNDKR